MGIHGKVSVDLNLTFLTRHRLVASVILTFNFTLIK